MDLVFYDPRISQYEVVLANYIGVPCANLNVKRSFCGKPFLEGIDLYFNVSHKPDLACILISKVSPVGVDLEKKLLNLRCLVKVLHPKELKICTNLPNKNKQKLLGKLFSLKEAILKAQGTGLTTLPNTINLSPYVHLNQFTYYSPQGYKWRLATLELANYWLSTAF